MLWLFMLDVMIHVTANFAIFSDGREIIIKFCKIFDFRRYKNYYINCLYNDNDNSDNSFIDRPQITSNNNNNTNKNITKMVENQVKNNKHNNNNNNTYNASDDDYDYGSQIRYESNPSGRPSITPLVNV